MASCITSNMTSPAEIFLKNRDLVDLYKMDKTNLDEILDGLELNTGSDLKAKDMLAIILDHFMKNGGCRIGTLSTVKEKGQSQFQLEEMEFELKRIEMEREKANQEFELKKLEKNLEMKRLELSSLVLRCQAFNVSSQSRLFPPFDEDHVDQYFDQFEKIARDREWPVEHWTILLQSVLTGKAKQIYAALPKEQSSDYESVKKSILATPEAIRQKFREGVKPDGQSFTKFAREMESMFDEWCTSNKLDNSYENLKQMMLLEQFRNSVPVEVRTYLDEKEVVNVRDAAEQTDLYLCTDGMTSPSCQ